MLSYLWRFASHFSKGEAESKSNKHTQPILGLGLRSSFHFCLNFKTLNLNNLNKN